jgi:hypothetical protein
MSFVNFENDLRFALSFGGVFLGELSEKNRRLVAVQGFEPRTLRI